MKSFALQKRKCFTIVEMAVVLLILGLLVFAITKAIGLIRTVNANGVFKEIKTKEEAIRFFISDPSGDGRLPGTLIRSHTIFTSTDRTGLSTMPLINESTYNGASGKMQFVNDSSATFLGSLTVSVNAGEIINPSLEAWRHLQLAGYLELKDGIFLGGAGNCTNTNCSVSSLSAVNFKTYLSRYIPTVSRLDLDTAGMMIDYTIIPEYGVAPNANGTVGSTAPSATVNAFTGHSILIANFPTTPVAITNNITGGNAFALTYYNMNNTSVSLATGISSFIPLAESAGSIQGGQLGCALVQAIVEKFGTGDGYSGDVIGHYGRPTSYGMLFSGGSTYLGEFSNGTTNSMCYLRYLLRDL